MANEPVAAEIDIAAIDRRPFALGSLEAGYLMGLLASRADEPLARDLRDRLLAEFRPDWL